MKELGLKPRGIARESRVEGVKPVALVIHEMSGERHPSLGERAPEDLLPEPVDLHENQPRLVLVTHDRVVTEQPRTPPISADEVTDLAGEDFESIDHLDPWIRVGWRRENSPIDGRASGDSSGRTDQAGRAAA